MKKLILIIMLMLVLPISIVKADKVDKVIYQTSFETEEERNFWDLTGDLDGDGEMWEYRSKEENDNYIVNDGLYSLHSESWNTLSVLTPDNLAISNSITVDDYNINQNIRLAWYVASQDGTDVEEQYSVYIFKGDETTENIKNAIKNNTVEAIFNETLSEKTRLYQYRSIDIKEYLNKWYGNSDEQKTIRIVFRHHNCTDNQAIKIDSVSIERYYKAFNIAQYNFESGLEGWTNIDKDGDGYVWEHKISADVIEEPYNFAGNNSDGVIASASHYNDEIGALSPENYIISPKIKIDSKYSEIELNWYVGAYHWEYYRETYSVYVYSGTEELTKDNIKEQLADESISQKLHEETLSTYEFVLKTSQLDEKFIGKEVQIIFVHHDCTDIYWLKVDDVALYGYITEESSSGGIAGGDITGGETPPTEEEVVLGDWNGNGNYTLIDLIQYRLYMVNPTQISAELLARVDLTKDGKLSLVDLIAARKLLVGLPIN